MAKEYIDKEKFKHLFRGTKDTYLDDDHKKVIEILEQEAMAKEYIERTALGIGKANRDVFKVPEYADGWNSAVEIIQNAPTADVVEVVRCKDCKYYEQDPYNPEPDMMCRHWCDWLPTDPDDYCSYGERKE